MNQEHTAGDIRIVSATGGDGQPATSVMVWTGYDWRQIQRMQVVSMRPKLNGRATIRCVIDGSFALTVTPPPLEPIAVEPGRADCDGCPAAIRSAQTAFQTDATVLANEIAAERTTAHAPIVVQSTPAALPGDELIEPRGSKYPARAKR